MLSIPLSVRRFAFLALLSAGSLMPSQAARAAQVNCVQFVERTTQMALRGNAWQWWESAAPLYARGRQPWPKAVMVFAKGGRLRFGHLAVVTHQIDRRTVLVDHANWSPVGGKRGTIENGVKIVDVSLSNDWSKVRVWYGPTSDIGQTVYAVHGFVYPWHVPQLTKAWESDPLSNHVEPLAFRTR